VNIKGTNITQLCQNIVSARVGGGDSGSPVFKGSTSVTLSGILWGGDETGTVFIYSPLANVERELGALRTF
jgi:V8-like Glu-specific endopeptidase